jgi:hypothetical protein
VTRDEADPTSREHPERRARLPNCLFLSTQPSTLDPQTWGFDWAGKGVQKLFKKSSKNN